MDAKLNLRHRMLLSMSVGAITTIISYIINVSQTGVYVPTLKSLITSFTFGYISTGVTVAFLLAHFIFQEVKTLESSYLKLPFRIGDQTPTEIEVKKINIAQKVAEVLIEIDGQLQFVGEQKIDASAKDLALDALLGELEEQRRNLAEYSRLQFIKPTPTPWHGEDKENISELDGYHLIDHMAKAGDHICATVFTNSKLWWLKPGFAINFFEFNLDLLKNGVTIERIFGINHPGWGEDEGGTKKELIQLHANLLGATIYTIDYSDFTASVKDVIAQKDHMLLMRDNNLLPSIEWAVDTDGDSSRVYHVFGLAGLRRLKENFDNLKDKDSLFVKSLTLVKPSTDALLDMKDEKAYSTALSKFRDIILSTMSSEGRYLPQS